MTQLSGRAHLSRLWAEHPYFDPLTRQEIAASSGAELEDRFYTDLAFGTGGVRAVIAAGTNRMNRYTVRRVTQGLAAVIRQQGARTVDKGVVIAYDSRRCSYEFALDAALVLNANGIRAYLWDSLRPTPMLSFAVRELGAVAGIVITASHNPPEYNGYKVYWEDGGQVPPETAHRIEEESGKVADITTVVPLAEGEARERMLLQDVPAWVDDIYLRRLADLLTLEESLRRATSVLYTPLHGTGSVPLRRALLDAGFKVSLVSAQAQPDPEFSTVRLPNPEDSAVFDLALEQAPRENPDIIMATDPDADRLGVMVRTQTGHYRLLTGNELGAVLVHYVLSRRVVSGTLPKNGAIVKTIATSNLVVRLCEDFGVEVVDTHVGFKFIGDRIREWEATGAHTFLFGFEESCGYLAADFVRDKDGIMTALLVAEAVAYFKSQGDTLCDVLERMWARYGYFVEDIHDVALPGKNGQGSIELIMNELRSSPPREIGGLSVRFADDYSTGLRTHFQTGDVHPLELGKADVVHYRFADGGFVMVRPSGTEPKLKVYVSVVGSSRDEATTRFDAVKGDIVGRVGNMPLSTQTR